MDQVELNERVREYRREFLKRLSGTSTVSGARALIGRDEPPSGVPDHLLHSNLEYLLSNSFQPTGSLPPYRLRLSLPDGAEEAEFAAYALFIQRLLDEDEINVVDAGLALSRLGDIIRRRIR